MMPSSSLVPGLMEKMQKKTNTLEGQQLREYNAKSTLIFFYDLSFSNT